MYKSHDLRNLALTDSLTLMPPKQCALCQNAKAILKRPKTGQQICKECFFYVFETEVHNTITEAQLFKPGDRVAIGASGVGTVKIGLKMGDVLERGDEVGLFQYGGSALVVVHEKERIEWDEDLREATLRQWMVAVKVRERVGTLVKA